MDNLRPEGLTATAPQQRANTHPSGPDSNLSVAMASDGRAIVGWETFGATFGNDNQRISIQARRLDPTGAFIDGNDVQINTYTPDDQRYPSVAIAANGVSAVAWQSYGSPGNDNSDYSIQFRAFDPDGVALDQVEVQANTFTNSAQLFPAAVLAPNGKLLVTWESSGSPGNDNDGFSIQGRLFRVFTPPSDAVAIPAVARVAGSGAFFTSRVALFHTGGGARNVVVTYFPRADIGGPTRTATVPLPANTQLAGRRPAGGLVRFQRRRHRRRQPPVRAHGHGRPAEQRHPPRPEHRVRPQDRRQRVRPVLPRHARSRTPWWPDRSAIWRAPSTPRSTGSTWV